MSSKTTRRMIAMYEQEAEPTRFLSSMFSTPPANFHDSEEVEIDIVRSGEDMATVITDLSTGANINSHDQYTNKAFKPPIYDEVYALNAFDLMGRNAGDNPFQDVDIQAKATMRALRDVRKLDSMVRRAVELQAAQVLQTGVLTLNDKAGNAAYSLDFKPKVAHFPTVGASWSGASDKLADINSLAQQIRANGLASADMLIFGESAWSQFIADTAVLALLDNRRVGVGEIAPANRGEGATFQGFIWIQNYRYEMWTYDGRYTHPVTGVSTKFIADDKVIVRSTSGRLDLTFGSIPLIGRSQGPAILPALPQRLTSASGGFGMTTNSWVSNDGKHLYVSAGSRPLCIPTAIDRFGCIDTII